MSQPFLPVEISPLKPEHFPACAAMAQHAPDPWRPEDFTAESRRPGFWGAVAANGPTPVGFAVFRLMQKTAELAQMVVEPTLRRQGIARSLLGQSLARLKHMGAHRCILDVRATNTPAIHLYNSLGFATLAKRPGLYTHPADDGLTMEKDLTQGE